jgi:hypothetical protein
VDVRTISVSFQVADRSLRRPSRIGPASSHLVGKLDRPGRSTLGAINASSPPKARDSVLPRKEVIQPHLPVRLPCYDFVPITNPTFDGCLLAVGPPASGVIGFHDVTGGVYKAREHIHRSVLTCGY